MMPLQTPDDAQAEAQMMQAVDELAERTVEADEMRERLDGQNAELEAARAALADLQARHDALLRGAADAQNIARRATAERPRVAAEARASALRPMLGILDDLYRALDAAGAVTDPAAVALRDGVDGVARNFEGVLRALGVEPIAAVGHLFDAHLHEALMSQPASESAPEGTVAAEFRRGYRIGDQVLRHSQVSVAA